MLSISPEIAPIKLPISNIALSSSETAGLHENKIIQRSALAIRALVIGTDPIARSSVKRLISHHADFDVSVEALFEEDARLTIEAVRPHVIFIDVERAGRAGLDVVRHPAHSAKPILVFIAANNDHALLAFELGAADYLLKPLKKERVRISLDRIRDHFAQRQALVNDMQATMTNSPRISITDRNRTRIIETSNIEWIGAAGDYTELHMGGRTHLLREPLSALLERLPPEIFLRIHRSFAVNLGSVSGFKTLRNQDLLVRLKDRTVLRASRTFSAGLKKAIRQQCAS